MLTQLQINRLLFLAANLANNKSIYQHNCFMTADGSKMCALGFAINNPEMFPGLGLHFKCDTNAELFKQTGYSVVDDHGHFDISNVDAYFGEESFGQIFGFDGYNHMPTADDVISNIYEFVENNS